MKPMWTFEIIDMEPMPPNPNNGNETLISFQVMETRAMRKFPIIDMEPVY